MFYSEMWAVKLSIKNISSNHIIAQLLYSLVYYKIRHEAKAAYSQNTIQYEKTYNIKKSHLVRK